MKKYFKESKEFKNHFELYLLQKTVLERIKHKAMV